MRGDDRLCVGQGNHVDLGSSALAALAAAEYLAGGDDPEVYRDLEGLTAFLRSMQRADGEFMHEYDVASQAPIDVQHLYYSGEAAFALLRAHAVLGRAEDLRVATAAMGHLTGAAWDFFAVATTTARSTGPASRPAKRRGSASTPAGRSTSACAGPSSIERSSMARTTRRGRRAVRTASARCSSRV